MKLDAKTVAAYQPPADKNDIVVLDDDLTGFGLRIRNGRKSFVFQYSISSNGRRVSARMKLGDYPGITADAARREASKLHSKVNLGQHPANEKRNQRAEAVHTFEVLVDAYLDFQKNEVRPTTLVEITRYLKNHARELHRLPAATITREIVVKLLDRARIDYGKVSANRLQSTLSAAFAWGIERGYAQANPCINIKKKKEESRDRVLDDSELKCVFAVLGDDNFSQIIRLLALTGQRLSEISELRWSEVDFDAGLIRLPASRTKNKRPHTIPMSAPVRQILAGRKREYDGVFASERGYMGNWENRMIRLQATIAEHGRALAHWTPHDLRRSFVSGLARLGVRSEVAEAVVNHISGDRGGVRGIYQRYDYGSEKAEALEQWGAHIVAMTSGEPSKVVVPLRRA
jgi:integrase